MFLNRAVDPAAGDESFPFALNDARDQLRHTPDSDTPVLWDDVRSHLQAALGIPDEELSLLIDETVDGVANDHRVVTGDTATLEDLSALYRHVSLARALQGNLAALLGLLDLTGIKPFDLRHTADTVAFVEAVAEIRASGFSLDELRYLLEHDEDAEILVGVTDEAIGQTLVEIRDSLRRITAEFSAAADPTGEITSGYLAVLLDADTVMAVMTALRSEVDPAKPHTLNRAEDTLTDALHAFFPFNARDIFLDSDAEIIEVRPVDERFTRLLDSLVPYLVETRSDALIIERLATFTGRGLDSVEDLVTSRVTMTGESAEDDPVNALTGLRLSPYITTVEDEITADADVEAFATLRLLHKVARVLTKLQVDIDEQRWLFAIGVKNDLLNPVTLPIAPQAIADGTWTDWTRLVDLFALRNALPGGELSLVEVLGLLESTELTR